MSKKLIEIDTLQSGQPRPYADSVYEATISIYNIGTLMNNHGFYQTLNRKLVIELTKLFVHPFYETSTCWADSKLACCEPIGATKEMIEKCSHPMWQPKKESRWLVKVIAPFTD